MKNNQITKSYRYIAFFEAYYCSAKVQDQYDKTYLRIVRLESKKNT